MWNNHCHQATAQLQFIIIIIIIIIIVIIIIKVTLVVGFVFILPRTWTSDETVNALMNLSNNPPGKSAVPPVISYLKYGCINLVY